MSENAENTVNEAKVVVTLDGRDMTIPMESLGITMDSSEREILTACQSAVLEREGVNIRDENDEHAFGVRKAVNSNTAYVYPKPVAG